MQRKSLRTEPWGTIIFPDQGKEETKKEMASEIGGKPRENSAPESKGRTYIKRKEWSTLSR